MTDEAILKAEEELKLKKTTAAPKINRDGPVVAETAETPEAVTTKADPKPPGRS